MIISKILNTLLMSIVFLFTRLFAINLINQIQDNKWERRQLVRAQPDIGESILTAICITLVILLVYEAVRWILKHKKIWMQSLLTGLIPSSILFLGLSLYSHNRQPLALFLGVLPLLITGILFPFSERAIAIVFNRKTTSNKVTI